MNIQHYEITESESFGGAAWRYDTEYDICVICGEEAPKRDINLASYNNKVIISCETCIEIHNLSKVS